MNENNLPDLKFLEFGVTRKNICNYLSNKIEQKIISDLTNFPEKHDKLAEVGFRRVENWIYKPSCPKCSKCLPIRIDCKNFIYKNKFLRIIKKNISIERKVLKGFINDEHFQLFKNYLNVRHADGKMNDMSFNEFKNMIINSPIKTFCYEYRDKEKLEGFVIVDFQKNALSAVYSFYNPCKRKNSYGTFIILDLIKLAKELKLDWLYLGYYIKEAKSMSYKSIFSPYQLYKNGVWK